MKIQLTDLSQLDVGHLAAARLAPVVEAAIARVESDPTPARKGVATKARKAFEAAMADIPKPVPTPWAVPIDRESEESIRLEVLAKAAPRRKFELTQGERQQQRLHREEAKVEARRLQGILGATPEATLLDEGRFPAIVKAEAIQLRQDYQGGGTLQDLANTLAAKLLVHGFKADGHAYLVTPVLGGEAGVRRWIFQHPQSFLTAYAVKVNHRQGKLALIVHLAAKAEVDRVAGAQVKVVGAIEAHQRVVAAQRQRLDEAQAIRIQVARANRALSGDVLCPPIARKA